MKKIITLLSFISISFLNYGQINNASFETWESPLLTKTILDTASVVVFGIPVTVYICDNFSYNELTNWSSTNQLTKGSNLGSIELVSESNASVDGLKSVMIESKEISLTGYTGAGCTGTPISRENVAPGLIVSGSFVLNTEDLIEDLLGQQDLESLNPFSYPGAGEALDFIPRTISGQYEYTGGTNGSEVDSFIVISGLKKNGEIIGYASGRFGNAASFTPFSLNYTHLNCLTPDTIVTVISSSNLDFKIVDGVFTLNSTHTGIDGSTLLLDALHLDTISPSEFPPILLNDETTLLVDNTATVNVLANDDFCGAPPITPIEDYTGTDGSATVNAANEMEFIPNTGFIGSVIIPYYACNSIPLCDTAFLTITYEPLPVCFARNDNYSLNVNQTITRDPRLNDTACGTTITIVDLPVNGVADLSFNGEINYSPNTDFIGSDSLTYSICSDLDTTQCNTASVYYSIVISGINEIGENLIKFYPNPAKNNLNITVDVNSVIKVNVFNTLGERVIFTSFENTKTIDLTNLNNGIYFVEIETEGKKSVRKLQVIK